jgi:hypothetical protein
MVGEEPNHTTDRKKAWSSINHSILSDILYIFKITFDFEYNAQQMQGDDTESVNILVFFLNF